MSPTSTILASTNFAAFTTNVSQWLCNEKLVEPNATIAEQRTFLLQCQDSLDALAQKDETVPQTITRFHQQITAGLVAYEEVPPFLPETVATLSALGTFDEYCLAWFTYFYFVSQSPPSIEYDIILERCLKEFTSHYGTVFSSIGIGDEDALSQFDGKEVGFLHSFYFAMAAAALYDPQEAQDNIYTALVETINSLDADTDNMPAHVSGIVETTAKELQDPSRHREIIAQLRQKISELANDDIGTLIALVEALSATGFHEAAELELALTIQSLADEFSERRNPIKERLELFDSLLRLKRNDMALDLLAEIETLATSTSLVDKILSLEIEPRAIATAYRHIGHFTEALRWARVERASLEILPEGSLSYLDPYDERQSFKSRHEVAIAESDAWIQKIEAERDTAREKLS